MRDKLTTGVRHHLASLDHLALPTLLPTQLPLALVQVVGAATAPGANKVVMDAQHTTTEYPKPLSSLSPKQISMLEPVRRLQGMPQARMPTIV